MFTATALHRVNRLVVILIWCSVAVLCVGIWRVLDTPVRGFVVQGELSVAEKEAVRHALADTVVRGILSTRLEDVAEDLADLRWARDVHVFRRWPDQLAITLQRAQPVAHWGANQYLSAYGDLLILPDAHMGLPSFKVSLAAPNEAMEVYRLLDQIAAQEQLRIAQLMQSPHGEWTVTLARGTQVLLGAEQLHQRMQRFLLLYRKVLSDQSRAVDYVDARYANGLAVRYSQDASEAAALAASVPAERRWVAEHHATQSSGDKVNGR